VADEGWRRLLEQAWAAVADDAPLPTDLELRGEPPRDRLPSTLPVADAALACTAAALLAASALHAHRAARTPRRPVPVTLRAEHVAAAVRSEAYLRVDGQPLGPGFAPLSRFWSTADGWVRTHANYPWHRDALLAALGTDDDGEAGVLAELPALDAEQRIVEAGGVAAALRTPEEWLAHPQGQVVAEQPLITETHIPGTAGGPGGRGTAGGPGGRGTAGGPGGRGTAGGGRGGSGAGWWATDPRSAVRPASGVRVLDLTRVIAGPVATRYLAALGADVLRVDSPARPELPLHRYDGVIGKRSALLDAAGREGLARLHELLDGADVLVHGYRPGALTRFGLDAADLAERHPGLVVVTISAWGRHGPWGNRRGFDSIVQVATGIAARESLDGATPGALPCQLLDHGTGYLCAAAALGGLRRRAEVGGTVLRELSLARTAHWLLGQPPAARPAAPAEPGRRRDPDWLITLPSADGPVRTVAPPGALDGTPLHWPDLPVRYGTDKPRWS
jgi:crotonobetainyl-CoA:carnitine CoA-transferase CaiB-like acyl-CoA transferase